jgi:hypothetical protein
MLTVIFELASIPMLSGLISYLKNTISNIGNVVDVHTTHTVNNASWMQKLNGKKEHEQNIVLDKYWVVSKECLPLHPEGLNRWLV